METVKAFLKEKYESAKAYLKERPKLIGILAGAIILLVIIYLH